MADIKLVSVAALSHQSSTDSAFGPAGSCEDDLPEPDLAAADQTHAQVDDLSAGGVSNALGPLSVSLLLLLMVEMQPTMKKMFCLMFCLRCSWQLLSQLPQLGLTLCPQKMLWTL